jgi:hypothetical protein
MDPGLHRLSPGALSGATERSVEHPHSARARRDTRMVIVSFGYGYFRLNYVFLPCGRGSSSANLRTGRKTPNGRCGFLRKQRALAQKSKLLRSARLRPKNPHSNRNFANRLNSRNRGSWANWETECSPCKRERVVEHPHRFSQMPKTDTMLRMAIVAPTGRMGMGFPSVRRLPRRPSGRGRCGGKPTRW